MLKIKKREFTSQLKTDQPCGVMVRGVFFLALFIFESAFADSIPESLRGFFSKFPQETQQLSTGDKVKTPEYFWHGNVLALTGAVPLDKATAFLAPFGKEPFQIPTPYGPQALAGVFAAEYGGTSYGAYSSLFFGIFVKDQSFCDAQGNCAPGFMYVTFHDSIKLATTAANEIWGIPGTVGKINVNFSGTLKEMTMKSKNERVVLKWKQDGTEVFAPEATTTFVNYVRSNHPGAQVLFLGEQQQGLFKHGVDELSAPAGTALGDALASLGFVPFQWQFTKNVYGVLMAPSF